MKPVAHWLVALTAGLLAGGVATTACKNANVAPPAPDSLAPPPSAAPKPALAQDQALRTEDERNTIGVFTKAAPSTVFVTQKRVVVDYFARRAVEVPSGSGSGFVWDSDGHIVTNFHVIQGAKKLSVTLHDHTSYPATIVGTEPRKDIAVLRIEAPKKALTPITVPKQGTKLQVGQKVLAIGNPFGLDQTLTTGIISALGREFPGVGGVTIREMIQTDAAINPGNSGGPLLDSAGRLIGMNTAIYSKSGSSAGIGFAVPVHSIARLVPQLIRSGKAEQVGIGVSIDPEGRLERRAGVRGVAILSVQPGSPAEQAGLRGLSETALGVSLGDIIVGIDQKKVGSYDDLYNELDTKRAGQKVTVKVQRGNQVIEVPIELVRVQ